MPHGSQGQWCSPGTLGTLGTMGPANMGSQKIMRISRHALGLQYGTKTKHLIENADHHQKQHGFNGYVSIYYFS